MNIHEIQELEGFLNLKLLSGVYTGWDGDEKMYFSAHFKQKNVEIYFGRHQETDSPSTHKVVSIESLSKRDFTLVSIKNDAFDEDQNYISVEELKKYL